jgi:tripartite-type tricarboxylate transporter receptor subunit TctC
MHCAGARVKEKPQGRSRDCRRKPMNHRFVIALACALATPAVCAQGYPTKSVRYIVPSLPGGGSDIVGRMLAAHLSQTFKQQVVVDNRAGGGGNIGAEIAAKSAPDGYTIFQMAVTHAINVTLYKNLAYDIVRDFTPLTRLASSPLVVTVHPSLPVKSVAELVQAAKAKPNGINYGSAGTGTPTHMAVELFNRRAGIELVHVPYKGGGGAQSSILAGETQIYFANIVTAMPHVQTGRLRAGGDQSETRAADSGLPDHRRERLSGLRIRNLVRPHAAGANAEEYCRDRARGGACRVECAGEQQTPDRDGIHSDRRFGCGVCGVHSGGDRDVREAGAGVEGNLRIILLPPLRGKAGMGGLLLCFVWGRCFKFAGGSAGRRAQ